MQDLVYIRAIERAAEILGGEHALAARLGIPPQRLRAWTNGFAQVPPDIFLLVVDILVESSIMRSKQVSPHV